MALAKDQEPVKGKGSLNSVDPNSRVSKPPARKVQSTLSFARIINANNILSTGLEVASPILGSSEALTQQTVNTSTLRTIPSTQNTSQPDVSGQRPDTDLDLRLSAVAEEVLSDSESDIQEQRKRRNSIRAIITQEAVLSIFNILGQTMREEHKENTDAELRSLIYAAVISLDAIYKDLPVGMFLDEYTQDLHPISTNLNNWQKASLDGLYSMTCTSLGIKYYAAGNLVITTSSLNNLKMYMPPIFLQKLSQYFTLFLKLHQKILLGSDVARTLLDLHQEYLAEEIAVLAYIRLKIPYGKTQRLHLTLTAAQVKYHQDECRSGKLHPGDPAARKRFPRAVQTRIPKVSNNDPDVPWTQEDIRTIDKIIRQIEDFTEVHLPRYGGCPTFAIDMDPAKWSWTLLERICTWRSHNMRTSCNKRWDTGKETSKSICLEIHFQVRIQRMVIRPTDPQASLKKQLLQKYREMLGLPFSLYNKSPLRFSVGHRIHGREIMTGWPAGATDFSERNDDVNNILIETWASNAYKNRYPNSVIPDLQQQLLRVKISPAYADEDLVLRPFDPKLNYVYGEVTGRHLTSSLRPNSSGHMRERRQSTVPNDVDEADSDDEDGEFSE